MALRERVRVTKLSCTVKFSGFEKGPFSSDSVVQFLEEMRRKYKNVIDDTKKKRVSKLNGGIERFSNDCRKTKTKAITTTNHNRSKQRDEPIIIPRNYL